MQSLRAESLSVLSRKTNATTYCAGWFCHLDRFELICIIFNNLSRSIWSDWLPGETLQCRDGLRAEFLHHLV